MRRLILAVLGSTASACAQIGEPPGGPADRAPPVLMAVHPDTMVVPPDFRDPAAFIFDEVVNEGSAPNFGLGTGDLERLVVLSPTNEVPDVRWRRSRITVRPREGWQPNRVYRVELLPGIADLRSNRSTTGRVLTFTTGAPIPTRVLTGRVVDWTNGRPQPGALVEAILEPDSLVYRTTADSTGRFEFGPLPDGVFVVAGVLDQNRNRRRDPRELFDTVRVAAGRDSVGELWAFRHDTVPPRIQTITVNDSVSLAVAFNQHLDPYQRLTPDSVSVRRLPDSIPVPVLAALPKEAYDSLYARQPADTAAPDTTRAAADTARAAPDTTAVPDTAAAPAERRDTLDLGPLTSRPLLFDRLLLRLDSVLIPGARYIVEIHGIRNPSGAAGTAFQGLQVPERGRARPDSAAAPADSLAPPDSVAAPPDTNGVRSGTRFAPAGQATRGGAPRPARARLTKAPP